MIRKVEILNGLAQPFLSGLRHVVLAEQDVPMYLRIDDPGASPGRLLLRRERDVHLAGNRSRDLSLQHENVLQVTLEALPPQRLSRSAMDQLGGDSHLSTCANDGAFDERVDVQLLRDGRDRFAGALVVHHGRARGHAKPADGGEIGDQLFRHAIGEILLVWLAGQILERQHSDRSNLGGGWYGRRTLEPAHREPRDKARHAGDEGSPPPIAHFSAGALASRR